MSASPNELEAFTRLLGSFNLEQLARAFEHARAFAIENDSEELREMVECGRELSPEEVPAAWLRHCLEKRIHEDELTPEQEIANLYPELQHLASAPSPENEAFYQEKLRRLQELHRQQARRMSAMFWQEGHLDRQTVDALTHRAVALLADDENPPSRIPTGK